MESLGGALSDGGTQRMIAADRNGEALAQGNSPTPIDRESVATELNSLESELVALDAALSQFGGALYPILRPMPEATGASKAEQNAPTDRVVRRLALMRRYVRMMHARVEDLCARLDL